MNGPISVGHGQTHVCGLPDIEYPGSAVDLRLEHIDGTADPK